MSWQQTFLFASDPPGPETVSVASIPPLVGKKSKGQKSASKYPKPSIAPPAPIAKPAVAADSSDSSETLAPEPAPDPLARVDQLRRLVMRMEGRSHSVQSPQPIVFSAGGPALDSLLPHGGLRPGTLVEWVCDSRRSGAPLLAMIAAASILRHETSANRPLVVVDGLSTEAGGGDSANGGPSFYPPAAISLGIAAESMMIFRKQRGHTRADLIWAIDQALRSGAVSAVYAEIGDWLDPADARRLQLAAEAGGAVGLLVRPTNSTGNRLGAKPPARTFASPTTTSSRTTLSSDRSSPPAAQRALTRSSFADIRWVVSSLAGYGGRRLRVDLAKCRGGVVGAGRVIEIDVAADRLVGYASAPLTAHGAMAHRTAAVTIREVKQQEVARREAATLATEKRAGRPNHAAATMVSDLVSRLADPATKAVPAERGQRNQRATEHRNVG